MQYFLSNKFATFRIFNYERKIGNAFLFLKSKRVDVKLNRCAVNWTLAETGRLIKKKNKKKTTKLYAYLTCSRAGTEIKWSSARCAWWKNIAPGQQNMDNDTFALFVILNDISRDVCRMSAVFFISSTIWSFGTLLPSSIHVLAFFMHNRHSIFLSFSFMFRNLAIANFPAWM